MYNYKVLLSALVLAVSLAIRPKLLVEFVMRASRPLELIHLSHCRLFAGLLGLRDLPDLFDSMKP
jgi:hypothetical protein